MGAGCCDASGDVPPPGGGEPLPRSFSGTLTDLLLAFRRADVIGVLIPVGIIAGWAEGQAVMPSTMIRRNPDEEPNAAQPPLGYPEHNRVAKQIGIDLGTANVLVYLRGRGIVMNEPSVVAISARDGRVRAVGLEARDMIGREPRDTIEVVRPMRDGVIADYVVTQEMLKYFINRSCGRFSLVRPEVMICVPAGVTGVERRAVRDAALNAGARRAYLISEPLAAAIGAKVPVADPSGNMIIDIGGGTTEVAVISLNGTVVARSLRVGGNRFDEAIANYIKRKYNLRIGERTAEEVKLAIGSAMPVEEDVVMEVRGRDEVAGLPRTIQVHANEITDAITEPLEAIIGAVRAVLEETPPELSSDIIDKGMILTGGGALLRHLPDLLMEVTGVPCYVADDPLSCVALGTGMALEHLDILRDSLEEP